MNLILGAVLGQRLASPLGWVACPPQSLGQPDIGGRRTPARLRLWQGVSLRAGWEWESLSASGAGMQRLGLSLACYCPARGCPSWVTVPMGSVERKE